MNSNLSEILAGRFNKKNFTELINNDDKKFKEVIKIALSDNQPEAWRAAWVLNHSISKNDSRIRPYISKIFKSIWQN